MNAQQLTQMLKKKKTRNYKHKKRVDIVIKIINN